MEKMMNTKTEGNTFTKKIGQTVYVVRYHFNEDAKETMPVSYTHLHQNYLKRKANGKQQEYYERTKAKKKAEMDAKKEEIRQEDIAKGVFVPVSLLPPAEPKKGVASA